MAQDDISTRAEIINQLDQKGDPYFNRFDSTQDRTALLFIYDRQLQNAELNEMQAIQSYYLGALVMFKTVIILLLRTDWFILLVRFVTLSNKLFPLMAEAEKLLGYV